MRHNGRTRKDAFFLQSTKLNGMDNCNIILSELHRVGACSKKKKNRGKLVFEGKQDLAIEPFVQTQD
jgi:hypothetical protein